MSGALRIALLGAESTGKSTLIHALAQQLREAGHRVAVVPEQLRLWCDQAGRHPSPEEHRAIAQAQEDAADAAASGADVVLQDTSALQVAIYGGLVFPDDPTWRMALQRQRACDLTLLAGLDLPWVDDGRWRGGPQVRASVDAQLRTHLLGASLPFRVIYGQGQARVDNAQAPVLALLGQARHAAGRWDHLCANCGDPVCERRSFRRLAGAARHSPG